MKRSGQPKPFRTIGSRMRDFGRSMMRHYVPPQDMPALVEPPPPAWSAAAQTPLVWPEPDAPASFAAETPLTPLDIGFDDVPDVAQNFDQSPQPRRAPRPAPPPPPQPSPTVQRRPSANNVDERLKNILAMHQAREAERQQIRDEKKTAFNAAEVQRQADPDAPHRPRRMSVDYVETSALSHGEEPPHREAPPPQSVQRETLPADDSSPDEPQATADDTERLDPHVIQASLDVMNVQREPAVPVDDFDDAYIPAGDEDNAQAYFESPPDWSEDSGDEGTPPSIDVPPAPMPPQGSAQRMPDAPDSGDFSEANEVGNWGTQTESEYPYTAEGDAESPPASDMITLSAEHVQRAYVADEPDEPDFGGAADFEPTYDDAPEVDDASYDSGAEFLNSLSATVQRDFEPSMSTAPDFSAETGNFDLPTFDMDEGETRPIDVQRAPILPPPDFADDVDVPPAETGYSSLADWMDAQIDAPPAPDMSISAQRDFEPSMPIAPDFSLQTGDFNQADFEASTAPYFEEDEGDTRRIDVQRSFQESDFAADAGYQPAYPVDDDAAYADYDEQSAPDIEGEWGADADVYTPPADSINTVQREYESADAAQPVDEIEQGYIEPADARLFFDETGSAEQPEWGGAVATPADAVNSVQREYEPVSAADTSASDLGDYEATDVQANGDVYTPPADAIQREYESQTAPYTEANDPQDADAYAGEYESVDTGAEWSGDVYTPPAADVANTVQREYESQPNAPADAYASEYEAAEAEGEWSGDANIYTPTMPAEESYAAYDAPQQDEILDSDASASQGQWGADADVYTPPPVDLVQRDYQHPADDYADENISEIDVPPEQWSSAVDSAPSAEMPHAVQREYESSPADNTNAAAAPETYENDAENIAPEWGWDAAPPPADQAPYDEQPPVNRWSADANASAPSDAVQRDYQPPATPDTNYDDTGDQPVDLYQAMMGAGMVAPDPGWNGGDVGMSPGYVQRTSDVDAHAPSQPVDVFQAMMQTGMVQPAPDDNQADSYYPPDTETSMSETTRADLLSLLDMPAPRGRQAPELDFTPDVNQHTESQNTVARTFQPSSQAEPPPVIQRAENESGDGQQNDMDVDQLARDVYTVLRNRMRIERERRDRKP